MDKYISAKDLHAMISQGRKPLVIDLRQHYERAKLDSGGMHIPSRSIDSMLNHIRNISKGRFVVIGCLQHYHRAKAVAPKLRRLGIDVHILEGGIIGWAMNYKTKLPTT